MVSNVSGSGAVARVGSGSGAVAELDVAAAVHENGRRRGSDDDPAANTDRVEIPDLFVLREGLSGEETHRRIAHAYAKGGMTHRVVAFYLRDTEERGLHQLFGCRTAVQYAVSCFGMSKREARDLLTAGRALAGLPAIDEAFCGGRLCWSKVRELVKVATPETDDRWLEAAMEQKIEALTLTVRLAKKGEAPRSPDDRKGLPEVRVTLKIQVAPEVCAKWERVRTLLEEELENEAATSNDCMEAFCDEILASRDRKGSGPADEADDVDDAADEADDADLPRRVTAPRYAVVIDVDHSGNGSVDTEEGPVPLTPLTTGLIGCAADHFDATDPEGKPARVIPMWMREKAWCRDHGRCRACGRRHNVQAHHIEYLSAGGPTAVENLIHLCRHCHALVHEGLLRIEGSAEEGHRFVDRDGNDLNASHPAVFRAMYDELAGAGIRIELPPVADVGSDAGCAMRTCPSDPTAPAAPAAPPDLPDLPVPALGLDQLVGQRDTMRVLRRALDAARNSERPLGHILLTGLPGLGKTAIGRALACELGSRLHATSGPKLGDVVELHDMLARLRPRDILFIDELHAIPRSVTERLYEAMAGKMTVVGATSEPGKLLKPLVSRFRYRRHLKPYSAEELAEVIRAAALRGSLEIDPAAIDRLASVARGTPRTALGLLDSVRDAQCALGSVGIDLTLVNRTLIEDGIDDDGLDEIDRAYLAALRSRGPGHAIGLRSLAAIVGVDPEELLQHHEPYLFRLGLAITTPDGRVAV